MRIKRSFNTKVFFCTLFSILIILSSSHSFGYEWSKTFGGSDDDFGRSVQQTSDGGFIILGFTESFGVEGIDVYLIKTDASGNQTWSRTFGGSESDEGYSVQQTTDGGYIIAGKTYSFGAGSGDVYLIKTDGSGNQTWSRTFGGSESDEGYSVQQTNDGGYIIAGETHSFAAGSDDVYLIKTDASGNQTWSRFFGISKYDEGYSVQQTADGGYIITGKTSSHIAGNSDVYLIKTDASGNQTWSRTFGGTNVVAVGYSVQQTADGGYIISGEISVALSVPEGDIYLIKTNASGNQTWSRTFGDFADDERGFSVQQTTDGGYIIVSHTWSYPEGYSVYLIYYRPELPVGHLDYCRDYGPCAEGEGDCDNNSECETGLTCVQVPGVDTCQGDCTLPVGHLDYCRDCGPCAAGEGDCDSDFECQSALNCMQVPGTDTCIGGLCDVLPVGHLDYCWLCGPCPEGEGDCDNNSECDSGLTCVQVSGIDTCQPDGDIPPGHLDYCRDRGPCSAGEGDCDNNSECDSGLTCVQVSGIDVCCPHPLGHLDYCRDCGPCAAGQGDCDNDGECQSGLTCVQVTGTDTCQ